MIVYKNLQIVIMLFVSIFINNTTYGQDYNVSCPRNNFVYYGVENSIYVCYNGKFDSLFITTNNGKITQTSNSCYSWCPKKNIVFNNDNCLSLYRICKKDTFLIGNTYFKIYEIDMPIVGIQGVTSGFIIQNSLKNSTGISKYSSNPLINSDLYQNIKGVSFSIIITRNDSVIYNNSNNSFKFSDSDKLYLNNTQKYDRILLYKIMVSFNDSIISLRPSELIVE